MSGFKKIICPTCKNENLTQGTHCKCGTYIVKDDLNKPSNSSLINSERKNRMSFSNIIMYVVILVFIILLYSLLLPDKNEKKNKQSFDDSATIEFTNEANNYDFETSSYKIIKTSDKVGHYTRDGYMAAYSKKDLDIIIDCSNDRDNDCLQELINMGRAVYLKGGLEVKVIDYSFSGTVVVRPKGSTEKLWTVAEAIYEK